MPYVDQYVSVTQAKAQLLDLIRQLQKRQDTVALRGMEFRQRCFSVWSILKD